MYAKRLNRGQVLFFRYAPPMTQLDVGTDEFDRPTKPHKNAQPFECSVFYFWWAYLRENADYMKCCANNGAGPLADLYADFGDVRSDDFMHWWKSGARELFCEPPKGEIEFYDQPPASHDSRNRILLSLPITGDLDLTIKELRAKLRPVYAKERQRMRDAARAKGDIVAKKQSASLARRPVHAKPVLTSLYSCLRVMQIKKANPNMSAHDVAREAGFLEMIGGAELEPSRVNDRVKQYERKAGNLIANVAEGRFPDFSPNPNARDAQGRLFNAAASSATPDVSSDLRLCDSAT